MSALRGGFINREAHLIYPFTRLRTRLEKEQPFPLRKLLGFSPGHFSGGVG
jgi:hypothetical protein